MLRLSFLSRLLVFSALIFLCHSAQAQITINPADILNKLLHRNNPTVKPNLPLNQIVPPANDNFANREQLIGTDIRVTADNRGATTEPGEPIHFPSQRNANTVWWTWTAPATGKLAFDTLDNVCRTQNTGIAVYIGDSLDTLIPAARSDGETNNYRLGLPVEGGRTYQIAFSNPQVGIGFIGFNLHFAKTALPPPVIGRDNFADRPTLLGSEAMAVADNQQSTIEYNEPIHFPSERNANTVWWTWTAPATGKLAFDTLDNVCRTQNTGIAVYIGDSLDTLIPAARSDGETNNYRLGLPVEGGRTYQIAFSNPQVGIGFIGFNLHFAKTALPPPVIGRDNFADRPTLLGSEAMAVANNQQATLETDEPTHMPGRENMHTVWWSWKTPATGKVTIDTLKLGVVPTALIFYTGASLDSLVPVVRTNGIPEGDKMVFPVAGGQTYQIVSDGGSGQIGFNLHFVKTLLPPPVSGRDNFADRATLKGSEAVAVANNEQASVETDEPDHTPGQKNANTMWWTWTAPATGRVTMDTLGAVDQTQAMALTVYSGSEISSLELIARRDGYAKDFTLGFPVKPGVTYQIVANGYGGCVGQIGFNLHFHSLHPKSLAK